MNANTYRVRVARLQCATIELQAHTPLLAEVAARSVQPQWDLPTEAFAIRLEQLVPDPERRGKFVWKEVSAVK